MTPRGSAWLVLGALTAVMAAGCLDFGGAEATCTRPETPPAFSATLAQPSTPRVHLGTPTGMSLAESGFAAPPATPDAPLAAADLTWPDFHGASLHILDHGAFFGFDDAKAAFEPLVNATVIRTSAADTGSALNQAIRDLAAPQYDVLYGVDNVLLGRALSTGIFQGYTPQLAGRIAPAYAFAALPGPWPATPVDHGYIALNVDIGHPALDHGNVTVADLLDACDAAAAFATQDPNLSTPGLGFLLMTIYAFGDAGEYTWQDYWGDLFEAGVLITSDWTTAYETHFSGGYGVWLDGHVGDRPVVTSYTTSPAYEAFYGAEVVAAVPLPAYPPATFHQIQTMGILAGTPNRALAEAWIEFTLTDDFQALAAPTNAIYPVVPAVSVQETFGGIDPMPGTFATIEPDWRVADHNLQRWLREWTDLCERHDCR